MKNTSSEIVVSEAWEALPVERPIVKPFFSFYDDALYGVEHKLNLCTCLKC